MDNDEFLLLLQAQLDEAKSKGLINADIEALQKKIDTLKLKAEIDNGDLAKIVEQLKKVSEQDIVINGIKINTGQLEKTKQKIQQTLSIDSTLDKQVIDLMKQFGIAGSKGSKAFNEIRNAIVNYRKELLSAQNLTGESNNLLDIFGNSADINKVTSAIANNIKVANDGKRVYEDLAKYISAINASGSKIHLPNSIKSEYGEDFSAMRSSLGSAFTTGKGTDFESFVTELNAELGNVIDLSHGAEAAFGDLVEKVRTTKEGNFLSGDDLFSRGILDKNEVESSINSALENIEAKEMELAQISSSVANNVVKDEEQKQQAIKETNATYQALAENESIIKSGAGVTTFSGIKNAQEHFRNLLKDEQAIIATTEKFDENNQLNSFTINIKRASGEVETLRYALDTLNDNFKLSGSSIGDTGAIKQAQQIENAFSDLTQKIAEFKSTNNQILSGLSNPLGEFETKLDGLKNGTYTITEVTNAFKNLKTEAANITKNFSAQLSSIDRAVRELAVGEQTIEGLNAEIQGLGNAPKEINDELVRCTDLLNNVKRIETENGRTEEWSAAYREWEKSLDSIRAKLRTIKKEQPNIASDIQVQNTITRLNNQLAKNSRYSKDAKDKIKAWIDELERGDVAAARLREINTEARTLHSNMSALDKTGLTFFERIKSKLGTLSSYLSASSILATAIGTTRKGISSIYQLDTALVDLRKTAKMTEGQLNDFYFASNDVAKQMGVTTEQILDQAAAWSRLGYNTAEQATQMAKYSSMFTKISPGMDIDSATDGLVSVMKAFKIGAEDVDDVVDGIMSKVNIIGNTRALSNSDIVEFLQRSSAAMAEANNTLDETIALGTAIVEITRDASNAGQVLKTVSMRIRGYDEETEEYIGGIEELSGKIADLTKTASTPGGISLFTDATKTEYKSTVQLFREISQIYDQLDDKTQAQLLETLAGKRNGQAVAAILNNFEAVEDSLNSMANSAGNAEAEMSVVMDSIEYKLNRLQGVGVGIAQNLFAREDMKHILDSITSLGEGIDWLTDKLGLFGTLSVGGGLFAGLKNIGGAKMYALIYLF